MSILKTLNHLYPNSFMEFLKNPFFVLFSSSYVNVNVDAKTAIAKRLAVQTINPDRIHETKDFSWRWKAVRELEVVT